VLEIDLDNGAPNYVWSSSVVEKSHAAVKE